MSRKILTTFEISTHNSKFQHPVELAVWKKKNCPEKFSRNSKFQHPIELIVREINFIYRNCHKILNLEIPSDNDLIKKFMKPSVALLLALDIGPIILSLADKPMVSSKRFYSFKWYSSIDPQCIYSL